MGLEMPEKNYSRIPKVLEIPNLIQVQKESFDRLLEEGLADLFDEISPIESYNGGVKLYFPGKSDTSKEWGLKYWFEDPKNSIEECTEKDLTYSSPLYVKVLLAGAEVPEPIVEDIYLGEFPMMTDKGTFIINGSERVVVSQLIRSPGVYFDAPINRATGKRLATAKLIPDRGAWMEFETSAAGVLFVKIDRRRKLPVTTLLRALGYSSNVEIKKLFEHVETGEHNYTDATLEKDPSTTSSEALLELYRRLRPGDMATVENSKNLLENTFFNFKRFDFSRVGRYKLNKRLGLNLPNTDENRVMRKEDIIAIVAEIGRASCRERV